MPPLLISTVALLADPVRGIVSRAGVLLVGDRECVVPQRGGLHDHLAVSISGSGVYRLADVVPSGSQKGHHCC